MLIITPCGDMISTASSITAIYTTSILLTDPILCKGEANVAGAGPTLSWHCASMLTDRGVQPPKCLWVFMRTSNRILRHQIKLIRSTLSSKGCHDLILWSSNIYIYHLKCTTLKYHGIQDKFTAAFHVAKRFVRRISLLSFWLHCSVGDKNADRIATSVYRLLRSVQIKLLSEMSLLRY